MLNDIDHVAIAVNDLDAAVRFYESALGAVVVHTEEVESDGVREVLVRAGSSYVQLLSPLHESSPVARFLATRGEGLHHVGYRVDDCAAALDAFRRAGARLLDETPRSGSRGTRIAFIHPKGAFGTLIELVEEAPSSERPNPGLG